MAGWGGHFRSQSHRPGQWAVQGQTAQTESSAWELARALGDGPESRREGGPGKQARSGIWTLGAGSPLSPSSPPWGGSHRPLPPPLLSLLYSQENCHCGHRTRLVSGSKSSQSTHTWLLPCLDLPTCMASSASLSCCLSGRSVEWLRSSCTCERGVTGSPFGSAGLRPHSHWAQDVGTESSPSGSGSGLTAQPRNTARQPASPHPGDTQLRDGGSPSLAGDGEDFNVQPKPRHQANT